MFCISKCNASASYQNVWGSNPRSQWVAKWRKFLKTKNKSTWPTGKENYKVFHTSSEGFSPNPYRISNKTKVQGSNFSKIKKYVWLFLDLASILEVVCFIKKNYLGTPGFDSHERPGFKSGWTSSHCIINAGDLGSNPRS